MFSQILAEAINSVESVKLHYETASPCISAFAKESMQKNMVGFALKVFMNASSQPPDDELASKLKKRMLELLEPHIEIIEINEDGVNRGISFRFKNADEDKPIDIDEQYNDYLKASKIIAMNADHTLIMLIIQYECFIASIFENLIYKYPEKYLNDQTIKYSEIIGSDIEKIKESMVNREIESIMRKEFSYWFKMFEEHKISFNIDNDTMTDLKEAYYRRNIIVHNNAVVNSIYHNALKGSKYSSIAPGTVLHANEDKEYLVHLFNVFTIVMYAITIGLLKLSVNSEIECKKMFEAGFRHMQKQEWYISEYVFRFLKDNKHLDALTRTMSLVNYWISIKNIDGFEAIEKEIRDYDFSAADPSFVLAQKVLLYKFDEVTEMLDPLLQQNTITVNALETWPLFAEYRTSKQFDDYKKSHSDRFSLNEYIRDPSASVNLSEEPIIDNH